MNRADTDRGYTISTRLHLGYSESLDAVRRALADQGFGILTEVDLAATIKAKLDKDLPPQVILGACRPPLAYQALQADPSVAVLLPCNVVVRQLDQTSTLVEAFDPETMLSFSASTAIEEVAADARRRLQSAIDALTAAQEPSPTQQEDESS
jgi:uncharacterized protein (DUF302 family)